jgi:DNA-binding ferritin-like protein
VDRLRGDHRLSPTAFTAGFPTNWRRSWCQIRIDQSIDLDLIAERIRALGAKAPGSYAEFSRLTSIAESPGVKSATEMIRDLVAGQRTTSRPLPAHATHADSREDGLDATQPS